MNSTHDNESEDTKPLSSSLLPLFKSIGGYIECETEEIMRAMMVPTCLMGPLYGVMKRNQDWLVEQGVPAKDASYFLGKQYFAMIRDAERNCGDPKHIDDLIEEQTPGGLNEQVSGYIWGNETSSSRIVSVNFSSW